MGNDSTGSTTTVSHDIEFSSELICTRIAYRVRAIRRDDVYILFEYLLNIENATFNLIRGDAGRCKIDNWKGTLQW